MIRQQGPVQQCNGTYIITKNVYDGQCNYALACRLSPRPDGIDDGRQELRQPADKQANGEEDTSTTDVGDDGTVEYDRENTDSRQNTGVLEAVADVGHLEEIGAISWGVSNKPMSIIRG